MNIKTHIPKTAMMNAVELPSKQLSQKTINFLKTCRNHSSQNDLPYDVYEEGRDDIIIIRMMPNAMFEKDEEFSNLPEELKQLLRFMADREIDIVYYNIDGVWSDEELKNIPLDDFLTWFIKDERLPIYDDNDNPMTYDDVFTILADQ